MRLVINSKIGCFFFRLLRVFHISLKNRMKVYFFFNKPVKKNFIEKMSKVPKEIKRETWREYYLKNYGELPDYNKYPYYCHQVVNLDDFATQKLDVADIIKKEEEKYIKLFERNKDMIIKKYSDINKLNGKTLAILHHTYGCDPTMIEDVLDVFLPEQLHLDYLEEYAKHKLTGNRNSSPLHKNYK